MERKHNALKKTDSNNDIKINYIEANRDNDQEKDKVPSKEIYDDNSND